MPQVEIDEERCKGCELCTIACPKGLTVMSQSFNSKGYHPAMVREGECTGCALCARMCPDLTITVYK